MLIRFSPLRVCSVPWMQGLDDDDWSMNVKAESFIIDSDSETAEPFPVRSVTCIVFNYYIFVAFVFEPGGGKEGQCSPAHGRVENVPPCCPCARKQPAG